MTRKLPRLLIAPVLCFPMGTFALGVGQIEVNSALNQILDAEIPLLSPEETELAGLSASLASSAIFAQYAIERPSLLSELEFSVQTTEDGRSFIKVTSKQPIREPLLNFLVQLEWPKGQLVREFTVLLDLPATAVKPLTSPNGFASEPISATSPSTKVEDGLVLHRGDTFYGPVARGEVLWDIAAKVRPDSSISRQQMMEALLEANPEAFWKPHIDGVLAGAILRIPSAQEIAPARFSAEVSQQLAKQQANLTPVSNGQPAKPNREENFQVKLVPPDVTADTQPQSTFSGSATATSQSVEPVAAAVLPADFRIKLKDNQPQLSIAGLAAVRSRIGALTQEDKESFTLAQEQENASAAKLQPTTAINDVRQPLESDATRADDAIFEPQVAQQEIMDDVLLVTPERQQTTVDTARSRPETAFPQTMDDLSFALPNLEKQQPLASDSQPELVLPSATPNSVKSQREMPESTNTAAEFDESLAEDQFTTSMGDQPTTSEASESPVATQPDAVISPPESTPETPPAAHQQPPGILTVLFENSARIAILGFLLLLFVTTAFLMVRRAKRSEEKEALAFEAIIPDEAPAQETAVVSSHAERSGTTPNVKPAKPFRATPNPLERADLLLAVGNHAEAENLVRLALTEDFGNSALRVKLLDIYFASGNAEGFLKEAETLYRQLDGEANSLWEHVVQMGQQLYPSHTLFNTTASSTANESATSGEIFSEDNNQADNGTATNSQFTDLDFNAFMRGDKTAEVAPSENDDSLTGLDGLDWELPDVEPPTVTSIQQPAKNELGDKANQAGEPRTMIHELDWESPDMEPPTVVSEKPFEDRLRDSNADSNENASQAKLGGFEFNEFSAKAEDELDDPLSLHNMASIDESDSATRQAATEKESFEERLNNVEIELERLDEDDLANVKSDEDTLSTEEYIETKLDLAMAYLDMGDAVGARNLLEEVLQEGNADQKQRAETFMAKLG